jgi:hypothetical protein
MNLSKIHTQLLKAIAGGDALKSHRHLDGAKEYKLHPLLGPPQPVQRAAVEYLRDRGLIHSNQKFPAATYLLTERGQKVVTRLIPVALRPVSAKNFKP